MAIVSGIFPSNDPSALQAALTAQNIDASKVKIVARGTSSELADASVLNFVYVAKAQESNDFSDDITHGTNVIAGSGGTGVPGIGGRHQSLAGFTHGGGNDYLGSCGIPTDVVGNYNDAIEADRAVAIYDATGADADAVATSLRAAGFKNVNIY